jgi:hypothetical protein
MTGTVLHDDETGFFLTQNGRTYRPITATRFDEGEAVRVSSGVPHSDDSGAYVVIRSADGKIVEDWKAV